MAIYTCIYMYSTCMTYFEPIKKFTSNILHSVVIHIVPACVYIHVHVHVYIISKLNRFLCVLHMHTH